MAGGQTGAAHLDFDLGVLAIAAEKMGYETIHAFDFDPVAVRVSRENAATNSCAKIQFEERDLLATPVRANTKYDVVCANLVYDILLQAQRRILNRLKDSGILILAGILTSQFPQVVATYQGAGLRLLQEKAEGEWTSGSFTFDV